ncbi:MAG: DUF1343 domain-containing protein, partial [Proteobacteria bacterium]|nr:DUF1343 domain-containing protein [Pseudomonadota bacterium]
NISSVDKDLNHVVNILMKLGIKVRSIMGPQHGFIIDKQDNMKESDHVQHSSEYGVPIYSLYGESRQPEDHMLEDVDTVIYDLQDVGARYYTFIYTMAYVMKACSKLKKQFVVLDRPNPINGVNVEGGMVQKGFESFVGMYPISNRHGMTVAELALLFNKEFGINCDLKIIKMDGWNRKKYWDEYAPREGRDWILPSPNMPSLNTALVYPGQCLLEATNVSEGRGTTKPFEIFGATFIKHKDFLSHTVVKALKGVKFRPLFFEPTFNKFQGDICKGFQLHVTDRKTFNSLKTGLAIIYVLKKLYPNDFFFTPPPYEYEYKKMPIDILLGSDKPRALLERGCSFKEFYTAVNEGIGDFSRIREKYLIYK